MDEELNFQCELCGKTFPADPETMVECNASFTPLDPDTGEVLKLDEQEQAAILEEAKKDPEIGPFLKGAICICHECQDEFASKSDSLTDDEDPS